MRISIVFAMLLGCNSDPKPQVIQQPLPAAPAPVVQQPLGPVPPGNYTNHIGNPAAGQWGPDGQWQWKDPKSPEADSTWKYLAAAGAGAAAGGLATYMLSRRHFEKQNPNGWNQQAATRQVASYVDRRGNPISKEEYERRRAQSERDKARYREQQAAQKQQQYRDKQGRFISKQEYERRQAQSARDRSRAQQPKSKPRSKPRRSRSRRR